MVVQDLKPARTAAAGFPECAANQPDREAIDDGALPGRGKLCTWRRENHGELNCNRSVAKNRLRRVRWIAAAILPETGAPDPRPKAGRSCTDRGGLPRQCQTA